MSRDKSGSRGFFGRRDRGGFFHSASSGSSTETEELKKKLAEAELKATETEGRRLLLLADMENLRKRCSKDIEQARYNALTDTVTPFLKVFDYFTMAMKAAENTDNVAAMVSGMKMIHGEFDKAFAELGIEPVDAVGKDFDPALHEAMSQEASDTVPAGKVIRQWSPGYKYGARILKAAPVIVSSGPAEAAKTEEADGGKE